MDSAATLATRSSPTAFLPSLPTHGCRARLHPAPPPRASSRRSKRSGKLRVLTIRAAHDGLSNSNVSVETPHDKEASTTGAAYSFRGATTSLTNQMLTSSKKITLVRHGLSSWNAESRIQGSTNLSVLTEIGVKQAEKCRHALANMTFDACFSSPISRAKSTAEIIWQGNEQPLLFLDSLEEAHLFFLEGMTNADAKRDYPELYTKWREDPANFHVNGVYPIRELWETAREAWKAILLTPGENFLVVTHKSILRALICTALGLPPERFRAIDVNNGGICVFTVNKQGEAMLQALNMTAHMRTRKWRTSATEPETRAPVTWSQNDRICPQIGSQPAWLFPFFPKSDTAPAAATAPVSTMPNICSS